MSKTMKKAREAVHTSVAGVNPLILTNCAQLSHMATEDIARLAKKAVCRLFVAGETVFEQGDLAESVFILLDGGIRLERSTAEGTNVSHAVEVAHTTFGDMVLLGEEQRRYDAAAARDSLVIELPLETVAAAIEANPPQGVAWRGSIMARLHRLEPEEADSFAWRILEKLSQLTGAA
jgi:CRP-like cAMP-binding protein